MYSILINSNNTMYGIKGKKQINANITPTFIGTIISIILLFIIICGLSKYIKDKIYYNTLLETIGLSNLPKINKNDILLIKINV